MPPVPADASPPPDKERVLASLRHELCTTGKLQRFVHSQEPAGILAVFYSRMHATRLRTYVQSITTDGTVWFLHDMTTSLYRDLTAAIS